MLSCVGVSQSSFSSGGPSNIDLQLNLERNNAPKLNVTRTKSELSDDYVLVRSGLWLSEGVMVMCLVVGCSEYVCKV